MLLIFGWHATLSFAVVEESWIGSGGLPAFLFSQMANLTITLPCAHCNRDFQVKLSVAKEQQESLRCPHCNKVNSYGQRLIMNAYRFAAGGGVLLIIWAAWMATIW